jgi:hypothetical protein
MNIEQLRYERGQARAWRLPKLRSILWGLKLDAQIKKRMK